MKLNPRGLVPTLEFHEKPLYESNVICELLEEAYPGYGPSLLPKDLYDRARMRIWQDYITSRIIPAFHKFLQHQPSSAGGSDEGLHKARDEFRDKIKEYTNEMHPQGPYFYGKDLCMIDLIIAPWAVRMWIFEHFKHIPGIPDEGEGGSDEKVWARWRKFSAAIENRDSIKGTTSDRQHYLPIYQRYADDKVIFLLRALSVDHSSDEFRRNRSWRNRYVPGKVPMCKIDMRQQERYEKVKPRIDALLA